MCSMVGAGGLGSVILFYLAAAGIGNIRIVDNKRKLSKYFLPSVFKAVDYESN